MLPHYALYKQSIFVKYIKTVNFSQGQIRQQLANVKLIDDENLVWKITFWREKIRLTEKLGNSLQKIL